ncbi:uncharacterized protein N7518_009478 [Penicillium psychrosexuale]|uniref:uncharacterized protein n=1 Tax=Penicillium psychrosexuale TaxID=1002107 RepID=UPI002544DC5F|nr:uncharacterized protein N7518_009478 [Penicillium psychrosexuale]KAJ5783801.1 hypothetical protein N7518_009478 [Penicillium psychrosexuale]
MQRLIERRERVAITSTTQNYRINSATESEISKNIRQKKNKSRETSRRRQAVSLAHSTTNLRSKPPPS